MAQRYYYRFPGTGCPTGTSAGVVCHNNGVGGLNITCTANADMIVTTLGRDVIALW
jgi:hypothetical protein